MPRPRDARPILLVISALVIFADRLSKDWIVDNIETGHAITLIPRVFRLTHVLNTGAAFSLGDSLSPAIMLDGLIAFSVVAVLVVGGLLVRTARAFSTTSVALALILGGALGNLYDRVALHHVVDFLEVTIVHYHWPDFNVADSCIVTGACLLMLEIFLPQRAD